MLRVLRTGDVNLESWCEKLLHRNRAQHLPFSLEAIRSSSSSHLSKHPPSLGNLAIRECAFVSKYLPMFSSHLGRAMGVEETGDVINLNQPLGMSRHVR